MEEINKSIRERRLAQQANIQSQFSDSLEKGKKMPIGTVSRGYKKVADGRWVPVRASMGRRGQGSEDAGDEGIDANINITDKHIKAKIGFLKLDGVKDVKVEKMGSKYAVGIFIDSPATKQAIEENKGNRFGQTKQGKPIVKELKQAFGKLITEGGRISSHKQDDGSIKVVMGVKNKG